MIAEIFGRALGKLLTRFDLNCDPDKIEFFSCPDHDFACRGIVCTDCGEILGCDNN